MQENDYSAMWKKKLEHEEGEARIKIRSGLMCSLEVVVGSKVSQIEINRQIHKKKLRFRSSRCGAMGSAVSLQCWKGGSIASPAQWVKNTVLSQLWSWLKPGPDPWPVSSTCRGVVKNEKIKQNKDQDLKAGIGTGHEEICSRMSRVNLRKKNKVGPWTDESVTCVGWILLVDVEVFKKDAKLLGRRQEDSASCAKVTNSENQDLGGNPHYQG